MRKPLTAWHKRSEDARRGTGMMKVTLLFATLWPRTAASLTMASLLLCGCTMPKPVAATLPPGAKPGFTVDTPLDVIAADPGGNAVLIRDVPGVMSNPKYPLFDDMSLAQIAIIARGQLPRGKLDLVQKDLDQLAAQRAAGP
jgi:hypothetical protein